MKVFHGQAGFFAITQKTYFIINNIFYAFVSACMYVLFFNRKLKINIFKFFMQFFLGVI